MRLVDHVRRLKSRARVELGFDQLIEDQEELVRIDSPGVEIVVAVFAVIEMKAPELAEAVQARHDLLDIDIGGVVAEIDQALSFGAELLRRQDRGAPVLQHGTVERGLVEFVLQQHAPVSRQCRIDTRGRLEIAIERARQILLTGKVAAIADPDRDRFGAELLADADALDVVLDGLLPRGGIGAGQ